MDFGDVIVHSVSKDTHIVHSEEVLSLRAWQQQRIRLKQFSLLQPQMEYLHL